MAFVERGDGSDAWVAVWRPGGGRNGTKTVATMIFQLPDDVAHRVFDADFIANSSIVYTGEVHNVCLTPEGRCASDDDCPTGLSCSDDPFAKGSCVPKDVGCGFRPENCPDPFECLEREGRDYCFRHEGIGSACEDDGDCPDGHTCYDGRPRFCIAACPGGGNCLAPPMFPQFPFDPCRGPCVYDRLDTCDANCSVDCQPRQNILRRGISAPGRAPDSFTHLETTLYLGEAPLAAPQIAAGVDETRVVVTAASTLDPNHLFIYTAPTGWGGDEIQLDGQVLASFHDQGGATPSHAMVLDGKGRPRVFVDEAPHFLTEFTADFILENPADEVAKMLEFDLTQPAPPGLCGECLFPGGEDTAVAAPGPGRWAVAVSRAGDNLYSLARGDGMRLVAGPDFSTSHRIGRGIAAVLARNAEKAWLLYAGGPAADDTALWLKELPQHRDAGEAGPTMLAASTTHASEASQGRSVKKIAIQADDDNEPSLHIGWTGPRPCTDDADCEGRCSREGVCDDGRALNHWTRTPNGATRIYSHGAQVYRFVDQLGAGALAVAAPLLPGPVKIVSEVTDRGLVLYDVTDPENPSVQEMLGAHHLLDAEYAGDGKVWVVYTQDATVQLAPFGGTPTVVSTRFKYPEDAMDLVAGDDGALHLFYTESKQLVDGSYAAELRYTRPLRGAEPTSVRLAGLEWNVDDAPGKTFHGLTAVPKPGLSFTLFYGDPTDGRAHEDSWQPERDIVNRDLIRDLREDNDSSDEDEDYDDMDIE